jgi:hypothetical protein
VTQIRSARCGEERILPCRKWNHCLPVRGVVSMLTEIYWFTNHHWYFIIIVVVIIIIIIIIIKFPVIKATIMIILNKYRTISNMKVYPQILGFGF